MHARLFTMNIGPGQRDLWTALAKEHFTFCKSLPGFVSANYCIFDESKGDYGLLTVWRSAADGEAMADKFGPRLRDKVGDKLKAPPDVRHAEVLELS
jgi:hypothetical protein